MIGPVWAVLFCLVAAQIDTCPPGCKCILKTVRCYQAKLRQIPSPLPENVESLDLRENHIRRINADSFSELPELKVLLLSKNQIEFIAPGAFEEMMTLEILFLHENHLTSLRRGTFDGLKNLKKLYLYDNRIQKIEPGALDGMFRLEKMRIDKNRIHCDCHTRAAVKYMASLRERPQVRCKTPKKMTGRLVYDAIATLNCNQSPRRTIVATRPKTTTTRATTITTTSIKITTPTTTTTITTSTTATTTTTTTTSTTTAQTLPMFRIRPADQIVSVNDSVIFPCQALRSDTFIGWRRGTQRFEAADGELMLTHVQPDASGLYTCQLINENGAAEHSATLTVVSPPRLLSSNTTVTVPLGGVLQRGLVRCIVEAAPLPVINWTKDGVAIGNGDGGVDIIGGVSGQKRISSLEIRNVTFDNRAIYKCFGNEPTHHIGQTVEATFRLDVAEPIPPRITLPPEATRAASGDTISLHCEAEGDPQPQVRWLRDSRGIDLSNERISTENGGFLIIQDVVTGDSGNYQCEATNAHGRTTSSNVVVTVFDPRVENQATNDIFNGQRSAQLNAVVSRASASVLMSVNGTINRLLSVSDQRANLMRDLFALAKFPARPSLAKAVAAEIFEEAAALTVDLRFNEVGLEQQLTQSDLEQLKELSGCVSSEEEEREANCDRNFCFHQKWRTHNG